VESDAPSGTSPRSGADEPDQLAGEINERYELRGVLGRGGMATVYDVTERDSGRRVAFKRLRSLEEADKQQRNAELFAREFHALAQLAHPRIVQAYDYGVDARGPYYTMELLDGGDIQQLAPLAWRSACAIVRDLCSALSLLHSRRLVHRDLSPRNVRRTGTGLAKLFDFGALVPIGPQRVVIGTPPCCAPETVCSQPLDGRTDLFALGATFYYLLVGRHAFQARQFSMLQDVWQLGFPRPSRLVEDIPAELDLLVLDLLRLEPDARPANAAEVIERLSAIDGEPLTEELPLAAAYLSRPSLVGRETQLGRAQRRLGRAVRGQSSCVVIEGGAGVGRSRFLEQCVLDASLLGAAAVQVDADDARSGEYGVLRAIARRILTLLPSAALAAAEPQRAILSRLLPELGGAREPAAVPLGRPQLQAAVHGWLVALAARHPLLLAIDDFDRIDEPSAALLSLLAHDALPGLCVLASLLRTRLAPIGPEQQLLLEIGTRIELLNLSRDESEKLVRSLFGDVPNVDLVAQRLHELADGNPRDLLQLAQHLVDRGAARYEAGAWNLPHSVDSGELPSSIGQALRARVDGLGERARELAYALALCPDLSFSLSECGRLCGDRPSAALLDDLARLIEVEIVRVTDERYQLARPLWAAPLRAGSSLESERTSQARLAEVLLASGHEFRACQHLLRAGAYARALDRLVPHAEVSQEETAQSAEVFARYARALPQDWFETYCEALRQCELLGRPRRDAAILRGRLAGLVSAFGIGESAPIEPLYLELIEDSGLGAWERLSITLPAAERIQLALTLARVRYLETPLRERVFDPRTALRMLSRVVSSGATRVANGLEVEYLRALPKLDPFAPFAPNLAVSRDLVAGMDARYRGRAERASQIYRELLVLLERTEPGVFDPSYNEILRLGVMNALGVMEACLGIGSSLAWADRVAVHPTYRLNAEYTRVLYHLYQGDIRSAEQSRRQAERLRLQIQQLYTGVPLLWEIDAHVLAEDLTRVRHSVEQCARLAASSPPWQAVYDYVNAEFQRIRGDLPAALSCIERALSLARAGQHVLWASMATTRVRVLDELGRHAEALFAAKAYVAKAQRHELKSVAERLRLALALGQARAGRAEASATADAVLGRLRDLGATGLILANAHEARARIALFQQDAASFRHHAELCRAIYSAHANPALLVKYERLIAPIEPHPITIAPSAPDAAMLGTGFAVARVAHAFAQCRNDQQRAKLALVTLVQESNARGGMLFTQKEHGPEYAATLGELVLTTSMREWLLAYLGAQTEDVATCSDSGVYSAVPNDWHDELGQGYRLVLLAHSVQGVLSITGAAILALAPLPQFRYPAQVASALSRMWSERSDVTT
jgi:hypothetical protein